MLLKTYCERKRKRQEKTKQRGKTYECGDLEGTTTVKGPWVHLPAVTPPKQLRLSCCGNIYAEASCAEQMQQVAPS